MTDMMLVAEAIATQAHKGQTRIGGQPFIEHPRRVADAVRQDDWGIDHIQVAWLHDVVEDTTVTLADLRSAGFSPTVVEAVDSLSRRDGEDYFDMIRRAAANRVGVVVKWHDNADNSRWRDSMEHLTEEQRERRGKRYERARVILRPAYESAKATARATWSFNLHWNNTEPMYRNVLAYASEALRRVPSMSDQTLGLNVRNEVRRWCEDGQCTVLGWGPSNGYQPVDPAVLAMLATEVKDFGLVDEVEIAENVREALGIEEPVTR